MSNSVRFITSTKYCDVNTLITQLSRRHNPIGLDAPYQREIVWCDNKQSAFIDSVIKGIVPNPIILNTDHNEPSIICIDGKQRLTSLHRFKNNKIPYYDSNNLDMSVFYDTCNTGYEKCRIMTDSEKSIFLSRNIPVIDYENLSYEDQIDVFNRIQNGVTMKPGQLIACLFDKPSISNFFNDYCKSKKNMIEKFVRRSKYQQYKIVIFNTIYFTNTDKLKIPNKQQRYDFVSQNIQNLSDIKNITNDINETLDIAFSKQVLNHDKILKLRITQNTYYAIIYLIYKKSSIDNDLLKSAIITFNKRNSGHDNIASIYKTINKLYEYSIEESSEYDTDEEIIETTKITRVKSKTLKKKSGKITK